MAGRVDGKSAGKDTQAGILDDQSGGKDRDIMLRRLQIEVVEEQTGNLDPKINFRLIIVQTELERFKFLVRSFVRARIAKVRLPPSAYLPTLTQPSSDSLTVFAGRAGRQVRATLPQRPLAALAPVALGGRVRDAPPGPAARALPLLLPVAIPGQPAAARRHGRRDRDGGAAGPGPGGVRAGVAG